MVYLCVFHFTIFQISTDQYFVSLCHTAFVFGDPHIITLDGHKYTFNGKGEFVLIQTPDDKFTLQGRMVPAEDADGSSVLATVFTAVVGKQSDSDTVQFELTENGTTAFVNGEPLDFSDLSEQEFNNVTVSDLGNSTFSATFSSGAYLEVKEENGIISVLVVSLPESFRGTLTTGLMGSFNGNVSDDLLPNLGADPLSLDSCSVHLFNGSMDNRKNQGNPLPLDSSLQEIHELFGLTCKCGLMKSLSKHALLFTLRIPNLSEYEFGKKLCQPYKTISVSFCSLQGSLIHQQTVSSPTSLVKAGPLTMTHTSFQPIKHFSMIQTWWLKQMNSAATICSVFST